MAREMDTEDGGGIPMKPETESMLLTVRKNGGFLTEGDVALLAADPETRLSLLLVRCGGGRFLAPADQVKHFIAIIEENNNFCEEHFSKGDYIRDVSLPVNFQIAGDYIPTRQTNEPQASLNARHAQAQKRARRLDAAAPDLLEACKFVDSYFGKAFGFDCADPGCEVCEAHKLIQAAVQK